MERITVFFDKVTMLGYTPAGKATNEDGELWQDWNVWTIDQERNKIERQGVEVICLSEFDPRTLPKLLLIRPITTWP